MRHPKARVTGYLSFLILAFAIPAGAEMSLDDYLQRVKAGNYSYIGSERQKSGGEARKREADLIFSPTVFGEAQVKSDKKTQVMVGVPNASTYNELLTENYSAGLSQTFRTGTKAKVYYSLDHYSYLYRSPADTKYYEGSPVLELTQPLWQNANGASDRAGEATTRAQAEAEAWSAEHDLRALMVKAEKAYWALATAREFVAVRAKAQEEAQAIYDYLEKRIKMNLADKSDLLQATASLETARLNLKAAGNNEAAAGRAFRACANMAQDENVPNLTPLSWEKVRDIPEPDKQLDWRADVKAAEASARVTAATARAQAEKDKPALDFKVRYALNGRDSGFWTGASDSLGWSKPTASAGLSFSMPLNYGAAKEAGAGALLKEKAAELQYKQKLLDQASERLDLLAKLEDARERLKLSYTIEEAQRLKAEHEKARLKEGRTTTYQVLTFEQDYTNAQYTRVSAAGEVLATLADLKLYLRSDAAGNN
jgi:outer membrane protein TolC